MDIISRKEAKEKGIKNYFTGKPCKRGHVNYRLVSNHKCCGCVKEENKNRHESSWYAKYRKDYYKKNREHIRNQDKKHYSAEYHKQWRENNREQRRAADAAWAKANPGKRCAIVMKRHAQKLKAVPKWAEYEKEQIRALYIQRDIIIKETGIPHHVDHIVPLQSKFVCGLHCLSNLQILTAEENISKSNSLVGL
jgi:hypothetical protein